MTLDREAALALFGNAAPMPATAGGAPFSSSPPFSPVGNDALTARMSGVSTRKGPDCAWLPRSASPPFAPALFW